MDDQITFCPNCGTFVEPDTIFCKSCGNQVKKTPADTNSENHVAGAPAMPPTPSPQPAATSQQPPIPAPPKPAATAPQPAATPQQPPIPVPPKPASAAPQPIVAPPQPAAAVNDSQPEISSYPTAPQKGNMGLILGLIGGVILLVVIGVGIYLALDNDNSSSGSLVYNETEKTEKTEETADTKITEDTDNIVNDYSTTTTDDFSSDLNSESSESFDTSASNYNSGATDFEKAFTKIYHDQLLTHSDIMLLSADELRILRNLPFAQAGRKFQSPDLTEFFSQFDWYNPIYNDVSVNKLTENDRENINLIQKYE